MLHGESAARSAAETARKTFEEGAVGEELPTLKVDGEIDPVEALIGLGLGRFEKRGPALIARRGPCARTARRSTLKPGG